MQVGPAHAPGLPPPPHGLLQKAVSGEGPEGRRMSADNRVLTAATDHQDTHVVVLLPAHTARHLQG